MKQHTINYNWEGKRFLPYSDETSGVGGRYRPTTYGVYDDEKGCIHSLNSAKNLEEAREQAIQLNENPPAETTKPMTEKENKKPVFISEWKETQFDLIQEAISQHFSNKYFYGRNLEFDAEKRDFEDMSAILGLAFTSSSSYAAYWVCNDEISAPNYPNHHYIGFALADDNEAYAILWDEEENEIIIPL